MDAEGTKYLTADELSRRWRIHKNTILQLVRSGRLPALRLGRRKLVRIPLDVVERMEREALGEGVEAGGAAHQGDQR